MGKFDIFCLGLGLLAISACSANGTGAEESSETTGQPLLSGVISVGTTWNGSNAMQVYDTNGSSFETRWKVDPNNADSDWTAWQAFGTAIPGTKKVRASRYASGAQIIAAVLSQSIRLSSQSTPNGAFSAWSGSMSPPSSAQINDASITLSPDNRLDLVVATDDGVYVRTRNTTTASNSVTDWSNWFKLDMSANVRWLSVAAQRSNTGLEQIHAASDNTGSPTSGCVTFWRTSGWGQTSNCGTLPGAFTTITPGFNASGNMQVFAITSGDALYSRWKLGGDTANWSAWTVMNNSTGAGSTLGVVNRDIAANIGNTNSKMHLFGATDTGALVVRWVNNGSWLPWQSFN